jgi:predicted transcriptional regulator
MSSITVELEPEQFEKLQSLADRLGMSIEGLARSTIEDLLAGPDDKFEQAAEYVLRKNEDLYRRLA